MPRNFWTKEEESVLYCGYFDMPKVELEKNLLNRSWPSIKQKAATLGLARNTSSINVCLSKKRSYVSGVSCLFKLFEETPQAYYWAGFICADGCVNAKGRLRITLARKDLLHLQKFCNFINAREPVLCMADKVYEACNVSVQDSSLKLFSKKFGITSNKTYDFDPLPIKDKSLFLSFLAGFIDGDGTIYLLHKRKDAHIAVVGHGNLLKVFQQWASKFFDIFPPTRYNSLISSGALPFLDNKGYARWVISNTQTVQDFKKYLLQFNLPLLERKWDGINLLHQSRYALAAERCQKYILLKDYYTIEEIAKTLNMSSSGVYRIKTKTEGGIYG